MGPAKMYEAAWLTLHWFLPVAEATAGEFVEFDREFSNQLRRVADAISDAKSLAEERRRSAERWQAQG